MTIPSSANRPALVVMGVSGCGKSSVGERLAKLLFVPFIEGDQLHPAANVEKMSKGIPLTDEDRQPWLERIASEISAAINRGEGGIFACSALKRSYRDVLRVAAGSSLSFVYLEGSRDELLERMRARQGHFMPISLLDDQLQVLEVPNDEPGVVTVAIDKTIDDIVSLAQKGLTKLASKGAGYAD